MRNLKKQLREKLRQEKREKLELRKELVTLDKDSDRAIEIRKLLGVATLKDLLGDKYPKRICRHCGRRAYTESDLTQFIYNKHSKYHYDNCCLDCSTIINAIPNVNIVGEHRRLKSTYKSCIVCGETYNVTSKAFGVSNHKYDDVCKACLGTHVYLFDKMTPTDSSSIPVVIHTLVTDTIEEFTSIREASEKSGIAVSTIALAIRQPKTTIDGYRVFLAKCANKKQEFISKMIELNGDRYTYNNVVYLKYSYPVAITCREHGDWLATPNNLLAGSGCPHCATRNYSSRYLAEIPTTLYYVYFPTLNLWKIGVTTKTITERFSNERIPVETLLSVTYPTSKLAYDKELELLKATKEYKYLGEPKLLGGNTELRTKNQLILVRNLING